MAVAQGVERCRFMLTTLVMAYPEITTMETVATCGMAVSRLCNELPSETRREVVEKFVEILYRTTTGSH